ncbi:hypothetical protein EYF80_034079 [Liparis tanakae]|uniref:Uncharacterized protein n=1 Tax=Liparis tanakae TaxID=230148 RepID=A0A4Z2GSX9_9TELE|nr:hypothetical protein EYF80_034079 [Liparis tanakae]
MRGHDKKGVKCPPLPGGLRSRGQHELKAFGNCFWSESVLSDSRELSDSATEPLPSNAYVCSESYGGADGSTSASLRRSQMNSRNTTLSGRDL